MSFDSVLSYVLCFLSPKSFSLLVLLSNYEITGANNFLRKYPWDHERFSYMMIFYLGKWCCTGNNLSQNLKGTDPLFSVSDFVTEKDPAILISCFQGILCPLPSPTSMEACKVFCPSPVFWSLVMMWLGVIHFNHAIGSQQGLSIWQFLEMFLNDNMWFCPFPFLSSFFLRTSFFYLFIFKIQLIYQFY